MDDATGLLEAVDASVGTEETPIDTGAAEAAATETEGEGSQEGQPQEGEGEGAHDARRLPSQIRSALKQFRDQFPDQAPVARALNDAYGRYTAYQQVFPKVEEARQARATLEALGGTDGVADIQARVADMEEIDSLLSAGDPAVLDKIRDIAGEGLGKLAPHLLDSLEQSDPEAYAGAIRPHLVAGLENAGFQQALYQLSEALRTDNKDAATKILSGMAEWFNQQKRDTEQSRRSTPDPREAQLTEREKQIQQREETAFRESLRGTTSTHANQTLGKTLSPYLKQLNLSLEAKQDLAQGIYDEVGRLLESDAGYQRQIKAMMGAKNRDMGRLTSFMNAKLTEIAPTAVKAVVTRRYGATLGKQGAPAAKTNAAAQPKTAATAGTPNAPVRIAEKPGREMIDYQKTSDDDLVRGRAWLKSGKFVAWR